MADFSFSTHCRRKSLVQLTPLIDVIFILLVFFMLATTFARTGNMKVQLGAAANQPQAVNHRPVILNLTPSGNLQHQGTTLTGDALRKLAETWHTTTHEPAASSIFLRPEHNVTTHQLLSSLQTLQTQYQLPVKLLPTNRSRR